MSVIPQQLSDLDSVIQSASVLRAQIGERTIHINDALSSLCVAFLERETEYAKSVKRLVEIGEVASAALIARTMLEGAACTYWVMNSDTPRDRAVKWKTFVYHESLKVLDEHEPANKGANIYDIKREAQRLQKRGRTFKEYRWTEDEQGKVWSAREVVEKMAETEPHMTRTIYAYYQSLSAFVHWSPRAFTVDKERLLAQEWASAEFSEGFIEAAVATAHLSLNIVTIFASSHFGISRS